MTKPGRIPCCIPFCRRTAAAEKYPGCTEIICGKHWRLAPKRNRQIYSRAYKRYERARARGLPVKDGFLSFPSKADFLAHHHAVEAVDRLWRRIKAIIVSLAY